MEMETSINLMDLMNSAPRCTARAKRTGFQCQSPAVRGSKVCRMHGAGGGAPIGKQNGNYKHGGNTRSAKRAMAEMRVLVKMCQETIEGGLL